MQGRVEQMRQDRRKEWRGGEERRGEKGSLGN